MNFLTTKINKIISGIETLTYAANKLPLSTLYWFLKVITAAETGYASWSLSNTRGHNSSFQVKRRSKIATVPNPGKARGIATNNIHNKPDGHNGSAR